MKVNTPISAARRAPRHGLKYLALLVAILTVLFWRSFLGDYVHFSNDGPLGQQNTQWSQPSQWIYGTWADLNNLGNNGGSAAPDFVQGMRWLCGAIGFSKFNAPLSIFILGTCAWIFFRALKLAPWVCALGGLAACLNAGFFSSACWGVASQEIALGMNFLALALITLNEDDSSALIRWIRLALAGLCVGMNVIEGADIGALCSMLVATYALYTALIKPGRTMPGKFLAGIGRIAVIAGFAGFMAFQTVSTLFSTQIQGIAGTAQDTETKAQHWDWATQWSVPKKETLGLIVPGLFGYKMDTPKDMMPQFAKYYENGMYWGGMGRDPELDRWFDAGSKGAPPPSGFMRFSGGGNYLGILVFLVAAWAAVMAMARNNSPFNGRQKLMIGFWLAVAVISLFVAWGRFAPGSKTSDGWLGYAFLYHFPYFSTIRNPCKFLIFFNWAAVVLFAYGLHALSRRNEGNLSSNHLGPLAHFQNWWIRASKIERRWVYGCCAGLATSVLGWLIFSSQKNAFVEYLQQRGFPDENSALGIAQFAIAQAGWFIPLLAVALVLLLLALSGYFSGNRAKWGPILLGSFMLFDLGRANLPYVIHWDYKQKYEVGSLNPIVQKLTEKPYEQRVAGLPFRSPPGFELFDQLYRIEWMQHHFPYYNIQCLDIIQMPRMPADLKAYLEAFSPDGSPESAIRIARRWQLTNTRYLLGPAGYLEVLNQQLDPVQKRFRITEQFEVAPKPGILQPTRLEELTAVTKTGGRYALFEFTGALPRVKLYGNWLVNTNDQANLNSLADPNFDPAQTVLVSTPAKNLPVLSTNENTGTVEFKSYEPKRINLSADVKSPSILLLNDKYDPNWQVTVDGHPAELLRCNFLMRGVYLQPGLHSVQFKFSTPSKPLYITMSAIGLGALLLVIYMLLLRREKFEPKNEG